MQQPSNNDDIRAERQRRRHLRSQLAPQMQNYAEYAQVTPTPYAMIRYKPDIRTPAWNTDRFGLRWSIDRSGQPRYLDNCREERVNLVLGASTVIGAGARSDLGTIPSQLSQRTGEIWLNMGGADYTLSHMLIQLAHVRRYVESIDKVLVFLGGDLYVLGQSPIVWEPYGTFNPWGPAYAELRKQLLNQQDEGRLETLATEYISSLIDTIAALGRSIGSRVYLLLEAGIRVTGHDLSAEEDALQLTEPPHPEVKLARDRSFRYYHTWFLKCVEEAARASRVPFLDLGPVIREKHSGRWLFVDPVHMHDTGLEICAEEIVEWLARVPEEA